MTDRTTSFPYDEFIDGLEEAIYWHNAWFVRGMRQLLLQTPASEDLITRDAHLHCKLAGFFGHLPNPPGHDDLMEQIESLHRQMHVLMRRALMESTENHRPNAEDIDELEATQSAFFICLHGLFRKVMEDRCASTSTH